MKKFDNLYSKLDQLEKLNKQKYKEQLKFDEHVNEMINSVCLNKKVFLFYYENYQKALEHSRHGNIMTAENLVSRAGKYIDKSLLSEDEKKLYDLICVPIDAYLHYRKGDFSAAFTGTKKTMELDSYFEKKFPIVFFHKIQQIHNLARISFRSMEVDRALIILKDIFRLLIDKTQITFEDVVYDPIYLEYNSDDLRKSMIFDILNDVITTAEKHKENEKIIILDFCDEIITHSSFNKLETQAIL
ncbi:hypothetical protein [Chryseobacterium sp. KMC2]|uniref:hypothetical protein n=1 Tax=Chryseobacterium sp. KMC2 TaxID=2800705 RepID=UPI001922C6D6|nr:hypothetical protein [Chryseobacterium sp. KMC2]MBL3550557.1 hypothetical protein [Chryseobacterium sp. KMC2]